MRKLTFVWCFMHSQAAQISHHNFLIRTVDTNDVAVLLYQYVEQDLQWSKFCIAIGIRTNLSYFAEPDMVHVLGPRLQTFSKIQCFIHILDALECPLFLDIVWSMWAVLPELTDALQKLSCAPGDIPKFWRTIKMFVILLYDRLNTYKLKHLKT